MPTESARKKKILVVDDDAAQRTLLSEVLSKNYDVLEAIDGESGLKTAFEKQPDLILLDNHMPGMSGYSMLRRIRKENAWGAHAPVMFLTNVAISDDTEAQDLEEEGPAGYLMKGENSLTDILEKIKGLIGE